MIKIIIGFVIFAALAMYILTRAGGNVDLGGEKHGDLGGGSHAASAPAAAASPAASAASGS